MKNEKKRGCVTFEKNGKLYKIKDTQFFKHGRKGLYYLQKEKEDDSRVTILIDGSVSNVSFDDCTFNFLRKKEGVDIIIRDEPHRENLQSLSFKNVDFKTKIEQGLFIDIFTFSTVKIDNIKNSNKKSQNVMDLYVRGTDITVSNISKVNYASFNADDAIDIVNCKLESSEEEPDICIEAPKVKMKNVYFSTEEGIYIYTKKLVYKDIYLCSPDVCIKTHRFLKWPNALIDASKQEKDVHIINDETLAKLDAIYKFQSCLKGIEASCQDKITQKLQTTTQQFDYVHKPEIGNIECRITQLEKARKVILQERENLYENVKIEESFKPIEKILTLHNLENGENHSK